VNKRAAAVGGQRLTIAPFRQILVHVLGEVAQQRQPLRQERRQRTDDVAARLAVGVLEVQPAAVARVADAGAVVE